MTMYKRRPDVLEIVVEKFVLEQLIIKNLETPLGLGEEEYAYYEGILIGEVKGSTEPSARYYKGAGVEFENRTSIHLTPNILENKLLPAPNIKDFFDSLISLLKLNSGWAMICEEDCDQYDLDNISMIKSDFYLRIMQLSEFCSGGKSRCPSFILKP